MLDREEFASRLKASREKLRLRQEDVAMQLGIGKSAYAAYESGKNLPPLEAIMSLLEILNVTFDWLTKGEGEQRPQTVAEPPAADAREIEQKYVKALEEIIRLKEELLQKEKAEKKAEVEKSEKL